MKLPRHQTRRAAIIPDEKTLNEIHQFFTMETENNHQPTCTVREVRQTENEDQANKSNHVGSSAKKLRFHQYALN